MWPQHLGSVPLSLFIMRYGRQSLGVIWIPNAFSSNSFQTTFYYTSSLGIPWGSIMSKKELELEVTRVPIGDCVMMWKMFDLNDQSAFFPKDEYQNS